MFKSMHTGFSSQVMGFYAQKKVGVILSRKEALFGPRSGPRPDHPAHNKPVFWLDVRLGAESSGGPSDSPAASPALAARPSDLQLGAAELTAEHHRELLSTAKFPPAYKYPFS
jgi:hypothetical protein